MYNFDPDKYFSPNSCEMCGSVVILDNLRGNLAHKISFYKDQYSRELTHCCTIPLFCSSYCSDKYIHIVSNGKMYPEKKLGNYSHKRIEPFSKVTFTRDLAKSKFRSRF